MCPGDAGDREDDGCWQLERAIVQPRDAVLREILERADIHREEEDRDHQGGNQHLWLARQRPQ